ncbi:MAG: muramoyltetrapeptide carboxypeptidase [Crocinitomicaceae bacterium]|jgi:muramoyltetrapeptide carboxypeptidase
MNLIVPPLKPGDLIEILAPAKAIEENHVLFAKDFFESKGFKVRISENCLGIENYFSGSVSQRLVDFQNALNDPDVKAIVCARGGYGCVQLVDKIQWANSLLTPKWIVGFSDVTVFHQRVNILGNNSIHGTMPLNFETNSLKALQTLVDALKGQPYSIETSAHPKNIIGEAKGRLLGGNLSILYSLLGTNDQVDYSNSILFIEDVAEQIYHLDRMFYAFEKAGILDKIKGLVVGGMTNFKDTDAPFGMSYEEVILSHFEYRNTPICFDFPAGHINDNRALVLGAEVALSVQKEKVQLDF